MTTTPTLSAVHVTEDVFDAVHLGYLVVDASRFAADAIGLHLDQEFSSRLHGRTVRRSLRRWTGDGPPPLDP